MKESRNSGKGPSLSRVVLVSIILHLLFISLVAVPIKRKERDFRIYSVRLVAPIEIHKEEPEVKIKEAQPHTEIKSKRGVVPRKETVKAVEKAPEETTTAKPQPKPKPPADISLEETERLVEEIERLRAIGTLAKKLEKEKKKERFSEIQIQKEKIPEEPIVAEGSKDEGAIEDTGLISYKDIIQQQIWQQWVYPGRSTARLEAVISIVIDKNGKIIVRQIEKSSGDLLFDRSVIKAILNASPLPPPPEGEMEIGLRFTP